MTVQDNETGRRVDVDIWNGPDGQMIVNDNGQMIVNDNGHYEPTNCRWADRDTQGQNRRNVLWPKGGKIKMPSLESVREMEARIQADFDEMNPF